MTDSANGHVDMDTRVVFDSFAGSTTHTVKELFEIYNERLDRIECTVNGIAESMKRTEEMVQKFIGAVKPVVDDLIPMATSFAENPMVRMMLKGKKS